MSRSHLMSRILMAALIASSAIGCASFSNPTTWPSVPVRRLPEGVLGKPREEQIDLPQPLLRQERPPEYLLDVGDTLGIGLEGVIGPQNQPLPIQMPFPDALNQNIGVGYPFPVLEDGTIALPIIPPVKVKDLSIVGAKNAIRKAYLAQDILKEETVNKLIVTLFRPRQ